MNKIFNLLFIPILLFNLSSIGLSIYANTNHVLRYKESTLDQVYYDNYRPEFITREYIENEVNSLFNCNYILRYKDLESGTNGVSYIMLKLVYLDDDLSLEDYALTLSHELVHIVYFTTNERFTSFKTFQILYESGNEYFKNIALAYADSDIKGYYPYEYSCSGYIEEYLQEVQNASNNDTVN